MVAEHAPQAEAFAARAIERTRPLWTWLYISRRRLATAAVVSLTVWLFLHVTFGANGMVVYRQKRAELQSLRQENEQLQKENARFSEQIKALKSDPKMIEKEAREQLHYARPGEVVYVAPALPAAAKPSTNSAHK
ncbi:MAG TPA: septum formation initiator family protein [Terriglobales bacterium]|nr:septum formation initiator family protein [Terriglobales bacterium]